MWEDGSDDEMIHMCDNQRVGMQCGFFNSFFYKNPKKKNPNPLLLSLDLNLIETRSLGLAIHGVACQTSLDG